MLRTEMEIYGTVTDISLPRKPNGKLFGFAFVTFSSIAEATFAMEQLNARKEKLLNTKVEVDWCLPKNVFLKEKSKKTHFTFESLFVIFFAYNSNLKSLKYRTTESE